VVSCGVVWCGVVQCGVAAWCGVGWGGVGVVWLDVVLGWGALVEITGVWQE
jgi:hypothetical protein